MSVLELFELVGRKMRGELAVLGAPSSLVLARSTGLACASFDRHGRKIRAFIDCFDDHKSKIFENLKNVVVRLKQYVHESGDLKRWVDENGGIYVAWFISYLGFGGDLD